MFAVSDFDGPVNFTTGAYYEHLKRRYEQDTLLALTPVPNDAITGRYDSADGLYGVQGDTYSAFGQLNWKIAASVELTGGGRYTHESRSGTLQDLYVAPSRLPPASVPAKNLPPGIVLRPELSDNNVSPEATLSWHPIRKTTVYGAYKTGFLSGGISNPGNLAGSATSVNTQFQPVKAKGGEIGAKGSLLEGRLSIDATAYLYDYKDLQLTSFDATTFAYLTKNAGSARVKGVEMQVRNSVRHDLSLRGFLAYNHGRFTDFANAQCYAGQTAAQGCIGGVQNLTGADLGTSPAISANLGTSYDLPITATWTSSVTLDGYY